MLKPIFLFTCTALFINSCNYVDPNLPRSNGCRSSMGSGLELHGTNDYSFEESGLVSASKFVFNDGGIFEDYGLTYFSRPTFVLLNCKTNKHVSLNGNAAEYFSKNFSKASSQSFFDYYFSVARKNGGTESLDAFIDFVKRTKLSAQYFSQVPESGFGISDEDAACICGEFAQN